MKLKMTFIKRCLKSASNYSHKRDVMKAISFVSFKGGAGRSVLLSNTAFQIAASLEKRVGCIDADLEAGGLHTVFNVRAPYDQFEEEADQLKDTFPSQAYLLADPFRSEFFSKALDAPEGVDIETPEFVKKYFAIDVSEQSRTDGLTKELKKSAGSLHLIPASPNASLTSRLDARGGNLYANFSSLIDNYDEGLDLDVMCIDCRSGISNLTFPALAYADAVVICMRWGMQHREGTKRFVKWFANWIEMYGKDIKIFLVISLMGQEAEGIEEDVKSYILQNNLADVVLQYFFIPYVKDLTYRDRVLFGGPNEDVCKQYLNIGKTILSYV